MFFKALVGVPLDSRVLYLKDLENILKPSQDLNLKWNSLKPSMWSLHKIEFPISSVVIKNLKLQTKKNPYYYKMGRAASPLEASRGTGRREKIWPHPILNLSLNNIEE